ncbi:hypothetical protein Y1Q_0021748 [Alligator mississippiensis]|uniref:Uncharacterized protein n=1 Tax=Alligator mississippiensis TaxID=8496 RepID=A0A151PB62_ALLMI|nr:hypothetical protein Y1Q_0021748 [Alligator mississippiensis]
MSGCHVDISLDFHTLYHSTLLKEQNTTDAFTFAVGNTCQHRLHCPFQLKKIFMKALLKLDKAEVMLVDIGGHCSPPRCCCCLQTVPPPQSQEAPVTHVSWTAETPLLDEAFLMTAESLFTSTPIQLTSEGSVHFCREQRRDEAEEFRRQLESLSSGKAPCNFTTARTSSSKIEKQNKHI